MSAEESSKGRGSRLLLILGTMLLVAALLAACSGDAAPAATSAAESAKSAPAKGAAGAGMVTACSLLTKADAAAILGGAVDEPQEQNKEDKDHKTWRSNCNYYAPGPGRGAGLQLTPSPADPAQALADHVASLKKSLGDSYSLETVTGIGGAAGWDASMKQLTIFEKGYMLIVTVTGKGLEGAAALDLAKSVAGKALGTLP